MLPAADIHRLQIAELRIFKELQRICDKHGIRYFLIGGSAIGAVRHNGFIPWDDDIDIGMPRPDYEEFSNLCKAELGHCFFWQTYHTEPAYTLIFGKLRLNGSKYLEAATAHLPIHHGIKIDVFPLDGVPRHSLTRYFHRVILKLCMMNIGSRIHRERWTLQERFASLVPRRVAVGLVEKMARQLPFDGCETVVNASGAWGYDRESVPRAWFGDGAAMKFEDTWAPVPTKWHEYLTQIYGDYMQLPPEDERNLDRHPVLSIEFGADDDAPHAV